MVQGPGPHEHGHGDAGPDHEHGPGREHGFEHDHHGFGATAAAIGLSQRLGKLRLGLLAALFSLAGATLVAELALRLTRQRERASAGHPTLTQRRLADLGRAGVFEELADPVRRYALRPRAEAEVDGVRFRISPQGTRGPALPSEKPAHERRILCLGDAFAFGLWCDEDETLVARLAARANVRESELGSGRTWRALDLGVPGYHLGQTLRAFEQADPMLEPDLVLLTFNTSDIEQSGFYFDAELGLLRRDYLPLPVTLKRTLFDWSHLYGWIASRHARAVERGPEAHLEPRVPWAHVRADNQAATLYALARIQELCRARGLPLFVLNQPLLAVLSDARRADWPILALDRWFRGVCVELQLPSLDLLGWLRGYADGVDRLTAGTPPDFVPDPYLSEPDFHLTGAGTAHIARLVYARMQGEGLLP